MKLILIVLLIGACLTHVQKPIAASAKILTQPIYVEPGPTLMLLK